MQDIRYLSQDEEGDVIVGQTPRFGITQIQVFSDMGNCPCSHGQACEIQALSIAQGFANKIYNVGSHQERHWHLCKDAQWINY